MMKNLVLSIAVGVGAALSSGAHAAPLSTGPLALPDNGIENVRMVCDEYGRCYRTGGRRVVIQRDYGDSYNYAPRERYIERRGYYDGGYDNGPSVGIGVGPGGVGFGVGVGPRW
jgi:hypothetical protein